MGKILIFAGSTRTKSLNARLAQHSARLLKNMGISCTLLNLSDFPLPLYQGDEEEAYGVPKEALARLCRQPCAPSLTRMRPWMKMAVSNPMWVKHTSKKRCIIWSV